MARDNPKVGVRNTKQRAAVIQVLKKLRKFTSAKVIHDELLLSGENVGLTTVYRTLQSLADVGFVDVLSINGGEALYRKCEDSHHHHHLVCSACGQTVEIDGAAVETWAEENARQHGFILSSHEAEIFGICPQCQSS